MPKLTISKKKLAAILVSIAIISVASIYLVNRNMFVSNSQSNQASTSKLYIDEILFDMRIKKDYHKIIIILHASGTNITITNICFHESDVINMTPTLPYKIVNDGLYKLIIIIYNPSYNPLRINNYTSYHRYLKLLDYFKQDLDRDKPMIIYKDMNGGAHKIWFSLYNYFRKYILKYFYTEYDYDITDWCTGSANMISYPNKYESCTALYLRSYSDKPIHIYLVKIYMYDKHHRLIRIERYKENITLAPYANLTLNLCFNPTPKGLFTFVEKYGKVYVYTEEGVIRSFEQPLFFS